MAEHDQVQIAGGNLADGGNAHELIAIRRDTTIAGGEVAFSVHDYLFDKEASVLSLRESGRNTFPIPLIPRPPALPDDWLMDNKEVRARNVNWLIDQAGGTAAFANMTGRSQAQISQLRGGHKAIGDRLARYLEISLKKPHGWLDMPQWPGSEPERSNRIAEPSPSYGDIRPVSQRERLDPHMVATTAQALRIVLARRGVTFNIEDPLDAEMFAEAYAELETIPNANTAEGGLDFGFRVADLVAVREARKNGREREQAGGPDRVQTRRKAAR